MSGNRREGLIIRAEPMGLAVRICERLVIKVQIVDGVFVLHVDPAWAGAINTVLVKKGVRVNELRPVSDISLPEDDESRRSARSVSDMPAMRMHRLPACAIIYLRRRSGAVRGRGNVV